MRVCLEIGEGRVRGLRAYLQLPLGGFVTAPCVSKDFLVLSLHLAAREMLRFLKLLVIHSSIQGTELC